MLDERRRMGKPAWSGFKPSAFPWKDFDAREWLSLSLLAIIALTLGAIALSLDQKSTLVRPDELSRHGRAGSQRPQRFHDVHTRRAPRWNDRCGERQRDENRRRDRPGHRIEWRYAE